MTADEADGMVDACRDADVLLMEAFMYRHHPSWVAARELVASGRIGALQAVDSWFSYFNDDPTNIRNIRAVGGGALYDIGCYSVNLSRMLFGAEPVRVQSSVVRDRSVGRRRAHQRDHGVRGRHGDVHLLDADGPDQRVAHLRLERPHLHRYPVQHSSRPADVRDPRRGWRPAGCAHDRAAQFDTADPYASRRRRSARPSSTATGPDRRRRTRSPTCA